MDAAELGWGEYKERFPETLVPEGLFAGRIAVENKSNYSVFSQLGELSGAVRGKMLQDKTSRHLPKVGDWVLFTKLPEERKAAIESVLPRATVISRKTADETEAQVIAANVDIAFIIQGLDENFNLRRLERYLVLVRSSGVLPVILLNKSDLNAGASALKDQVLAHSGGAPVHLVSAKTGEGLNSVKAYFAPGKTITFIGSSGVGKSSLVNALLGSQVQKTAEVREGDAKGRHTTTRRELIILPSGGILIDTPGMRELGLSAGEESPDNTFEELELLAGQCEYGDCDHEKSRGCAILEAVRQGTVSRGRYQSFIKLRREAIFQAAKNDIKARLERKSSKKSLNKIKKQYQRLNGKYR